jgi:hypothetical protein
VSGEKGTVAFAAFAGGSVFRRGDAVCRTASRANDVAQIAVHVFPHRLNKTANVTKSCKGASTGGAWNFAFWTAFFWQEAVKKKLL